MRRVFFISLELHFLFWEATLFQHRPRFTFDIVAPYYVVFLPFVEDYMRITAIIFSYTIDEMGRNVKMTDKRQILCGY